MWQVMDLSAASISEGPKGLFGRVQISTSCVRDNLVAAGGFRGELAITNMEAGAGLAFRWASALRAATPVWMDLFSVGVQASLALPCNLTHMLCVIAQHVCDICGKCHHQRHRDIRGAVGSDARHDVQQRHVAARL